MNPTTVHFEVWKEGIKGEWSRMTLPDGYATVFDTFKAAEKAAKSLIQDGLLLRAVVVQFSPVLTVNCGGVHAAKMGLTRPGVRIEGGSFRIGPKPR